MALLHHLSEGQTSINQITVSPADGHSFPFNMVLMMKIFFQICFFFFLISLCSPSSGGTQDLPISYIGAYFTISLSFCHFRCLLVGHAMSPHQSDDQTKGSVTQDLPISYFGRSFTISAAAKASNMSHTLSDC